MNKELEMKEGIAHTRNSEKFRIAKFRISGVKRCG